MKTHGYYRFPSIHGDNVVFVSEDDLWTVPATGGIARRLTSGLGAVSYPAYSPDGRWIAFVGCEEGQTEVYLIPATGGEPRRLTFLGANCLVTGWRTKADGSAQIVFSSNTAQPFPHLYHLYALSPDGGAPELLPTGPAFSVSFGPKGGCVIGRNIIDPARWKRYRGGRAGDLWIDPSGAGNFRRLITLKGNLSRPLWMGGRIFFLSDHEGVGNMYSCLPSGKDLRRHTHHQDFYVRHPAGDGRRIVYHAGADVFVFDPATDETRQIEIECHSPRPQRSRKFVEAARYLEECALHPQGHLLAISTRGKVFTGGNFEGPVVQHGDAESVRYRHPRWLADGRRLLLVSDAGGEPRVQILDSLAPGQVTTLADLEIGTPVEVRVSPKADMVALSNHRNELLCVDFSSTPAMCRVLDRSAFVPIKGFDWSPDGRWLAYSCGLSLHTTAIRMCNVETGEIQDITRPVLEDVRPCFDPGGKYLYFLSHREFDPVYDNLHFDLGFPRGVKPYLVTLRRDLPSPFVAVPKPAAEKNKGAAEKGEQAAKPDEPLAIDFDGIAERVLAFPVPDGRYEQIAAIDGKLLYTSLPIEGSLNQGWLPSLEPSAKATLEAYDFEAQKSEVLVSGVSDFTVSQDRRTLLYRAGNRLRVIKAGEKPDEKTDREPPGKKSGWIDLNRVRVSIKPPAEWRQMYREAWRLQRDHFWTENMSSVDWTHIYERYLPLLDRIASRAEFSDLLWEMQGELGTSHAYEMGGDHRREPRYDLGFLGADLNFDATTKTWRVTRIVRGDCWDETRHSPLALAGTNIKEGDSILAIGGRPLSQDVSPQELLVHQARLEVQLLVASAASGGGIRPDGSGVEPRLVSVKTMASETPARYREWVENNRRIVHERSKGQVGYVHIPNMGPWGYAEFHRYFLAEIDRHGLIIDVRFNGGGHVSELILEKLARRRVGWCQTRWFGALPHPKDSVAGPMLALTDQFAGSDGDIFSHGFKMLKLGPLIGKRTWGGVIGIWPRSVLVDGSVTTQPEYSFWFNDVGWEIENYGTDPDIEVDMRPQDYAAGRDAQLERGLKEMARLLKDRPPRPLDLGQRPSLTLPKLPA
jgi:tricorn protease